MTTAWILVVTLVFDVSLMGALFWKMPDWSRPELLFGVTVPAQVRRGESGQAVIGWYRRRVALITVIALAAAWMPLLPGERSGSGTAVVTVVIIAHIVSMLGTFLGARRRALPLAAAPSGTRVALVDRHRDRLPGGWFWQLGPFVLFAGVIAVLVWCWPQIPDRFVTHWNGAFEPDGWSDKSVASVFGLVALGFALISIFPPIAWSLMNRSRRVHVDGAAGRSESLRRRAVAVLLLWLEYLMVATFAPLALVPLAQTPTLAKAMAIGVLLTAIVGPIAMIVVWFVRYGSVLTTRTRDAEAASDGSPIGDRTEDRFWKWGLVYYNPDDPVLWVEKRFGVGYTFNMARPSAWLILGGLIGLPIALAVVIAVAS